MSRNQIMGITVAVLSVLLLAYVSTLEDASNCRIRMNDPRLKEQLTPEQRAYCTTVLQEASVGAPRKL